MLDNALNINNLTFEISKMGYTVPSRIRKRDGSIVDFDPKRIISAVNACMQRVGENGVTGVDVAYSVVRALSAKFDGDLPTVEDVQDAVEFSLFSAGKFASAKAYITWRQEHKNERSEDPIPEDVLQAFEIDKQYFATPSQQFMFYDKYSRYNYELGRRETWPETVNRVVDHLRWLVAEHDRESFNQLVTMDVFEEIHQGILNMKIMPSMRMLAMAGPAARRNGLSIYNCSALPVKDIDSFVEALIISMSGCGVGYSVESHYVEQFPRIKRQKKNQDIETHIIEDSSEGWADALRLGLNKWWKGEDIKFDFSFIRPAGAPLRTKGGRSSGPEPFRKMLDFCRSLILARQGTFIRTTDAHLMMCSIGEASIQGGVRRTALISLFDKDDHAMRAIKNGPSIDPLLWNANNSVVWPEDISDLDIIEQMTEMIKGNAGEPGIFSRTNANSSKPTRRKKARFLTNPCGEINLREHGLCNLSVAVVRHDDTEETLAEKVRLATIVGTIQSLTTNFPGMRDEWKKNCEEERLLGVDLTGQSDHVVLAEVSEDGARIRRDLKQLAVEVNKEFAQILGINQSAAVTCNKPSGNSSELLDCASGIHARHSQYYIRNMRLSVTSPLFKVLRSAGVPMDPENGQTVENATTWVIHFPKKSPDGAKLKEHRSAVEQCEFWLLNKNNWTEHNPSVTITYRPDEIMDLIKWVVEHKDRVGGMSFLPVSNSAYAQLPYEEISQEKYEELVSKFPRIDYSKLYRYEKDDMTTSAQELSCFAGQCEL